MPARPWSRGPEVAPTCSSATPAKAPARGKHRSELEGLWPWQGQPRPWVPAEKGAHPTVGTRPIVRAWKITALGCSYEKWVPT